MLASIPLGKLKVNRQRTTVRSSVLALGRGGCTKTSQNPGICKIGLTLTPSQSWHSGGFDETNAEMRLATF